MGVLSASGGSVLPGPCRIFTQFEQEPIIAKRLGAGAATGTAGDRNEMLVGGYGLMPGAAFEYTILGTQTIVAPGLTANGLDLGSMDQTAADGVEVHNGLTARNPVACVVGTDGAFYVKAKFKVADASGCNPLMIGFRKVEAHQADHNDYDELVGIGIDGTAGDIKITKILNNAATSVVDTTMDWADAAEIELGVYVSATGVVTFTVAGAAPTVTTTFTFDNAEVIIPFVRFIQAADIAGTVEWSMYDAGAQ